MRLNKSAILSLAFAAALGVVGGVPASAATASTDVPGTVLQIVLTGTDAMGTDNYANRSREFVTFKNGTGADVNIDGVVVEDNWSRNTAATHTCNRYEITSLPGQGSAAVLKSGETVTVFNGSRWGGNRLVGSEYRLYANSDSDCGTAGHFLNNDADTVYVVQGGTVMSSYSWDHNGGYTFKPVGG